MIDVKTISRRSYPGALTGLSLAIVLGFALATSQQAAAESDKSNKIIELALQATPDLQSGWQQFFNCAVCHTPEGWGSPNGVFPQISGQHQSVTLKQLLDIRDGNRDNPTMAPFAGTALKKNPQDLANLSAYIEQLPMVPNNSVGPGWKLAEGEKLYQDNCKKCHGENGEGDAAEFYPKIHGQHYQYLLRQLHWIQSGKRRNADKKMVKQIKSFNDKELSQVADYVSRLRPDESLLADHLDWRNADFRNGFMTAPKAQYQHKNQ